MVFDGLLAYIPRGNNGSELSMAIGERIGKTGKANKKRKAYGNAN
jgi:hypothetical protein